MSKSKVFFITIFISITNLAYGQALCVDQGDQIDYEANEIHTTYQSLRTGELGINRMSFTPNFLFGARPSENLVSDAANRLPYFLLICFEGANNTLAYRMSTAPNGYPHELNNPNNNFNQANFGQHMLHPNTHHSPTSFVLEEDHMRVEGIETDEEGDEIGSVIFQRNYFVLNPRRKLYKRSFFEVDTDGTMFFYNNPIKNRKGDIVLTNEVKEIYKEIIYNSLIGIYVVNLVTEYIVGEPDKRIVWRSDTGNVLNPARRLEASHEALSILDDNPDNDIDVTQAIETVDNNSVTKHGSLLISEDERFFLRVYPNSIKLFFEDDFGDDISFEFESLFGVPPINQINYQTISSDFEPYINVSYYGVVLIKNSLTKNVEAEIGENCISPEPEQNHKFYSNSIGDFVMESPNHIVWQKNKLDANIYCNFPTIGQSSLNQNQKLLNFNKKIYNSNELNYILSEDKSKIMIKIDNQIKVIQKSDFNGNFITSPSLQNYSF